MKRERERPDESITNLLSIISIAVVALLLILLFKVKGGILGMALGIIAVAALIYWLKEVKKIFREEKAYSEEAEWFYDLINEEESVTLIAKVPGPAEKVKVRLVNGMLEIEGGGNFMRKVHIPKDAQLQNKSYINGVLQVKLQRVETHNSKMPSKHI